MGEEKRAPVLEPLLKSGKKEELRLAVRTWRESMKLWRIVGPAIISRVSSYSMIVITQAFAGHIGDLELGAMTIANTVVLGFNLGLLLGMASALETLCGQAFGAKRYEMLGIYLQRSWIVLFICSVLLLPMYFYADSILVLLGQSPELAAEAGIICIWFIPIHFCFAFMFPMQRFLQSQLKNYVSAVVSTVSLIIHFFISWLIVSKFKLGVVGAAIALDFSWWINIFLLASYVYCGGCPLTWKGLSMDAFSGLWEFLKLSAASGVMLCLENWYYRILLLLTGNLKDSELAVDALSVCMGINGLEMMIPLSFFAGTGVRVANELGAGNGKAARFATIVSAVTSTIIGIFFCTLVMLLRAKVALVFTSSAAILDAVDSLSYLLGMTILLNSIQPVLSGVAVGSGWQSFVAYVNIGTYYLIGIPVGMIMGWVFGFGVMGIWGGMIGGTAVQTLILAFMTIRCDWDKQALMANTRMENLDK